MLMHFDVSKFILLVEVACYGNLICPKKLIKKNVFTVKLLNSTCHVNLETNLWFSCETLRLKIGIKNHLSF